MTETVKGWILEEDLPPRFGLKPIRKFDGLYPNDDEEWEAYRDFMHWAMTRDIAVLLTIPAPQNDTRFREFEDDFSISFPYSSMDYQRHHPFDKYAYKLSKIYEKVHELAIRHSCISQQEGKTGTIKRFEKLVNEEFRDKLHMLLETYRKYPHLVNRDKLAVRTAELNARIQKCKSIWQKHAYSD